VVTIRRNGREVAQLEGAIHYIPALDLEFREVSALGMEPGCAMVRITPADRSTSNRIDRGQHVLR